MNFSDWITIVSILLAVLIAVFKFDEWEIIWLKQLKKYFLFPLLFLFISGLSSYFQTNTHPSWIEFFWITSGLQSGVWSIIWLLFFFVSTFFCWRKFSNAKPSPELINKYLDYIDTYEPSRFSSLFRKYERYFFNSNDEHAWFPYEILLTNKKWWSIVPSYFKEVVFENPNRFHIMKREVLKSLLFAQLDDIPHSQLTNELEAQNNGVVLSKETPILNIFLSSPYYIEISRDSNILLQTIDEIADEYFNSIEFKEKDKINFLLNPSKKSLSQVAPKSLTLFYYIQFIDCYWYQVINLKAKVSGFFFYLTWTEKLLEAAPVYITKNNCESLPNLYVVAVNKMLSNISNWIGLFESENHIELSWAAEHFIKLNQEILSCIEDRYLDKIPEDWFVTKSKSFLIRMIDCRNIFQDRFNPNFNDKLRGLSKLNTAFEKLTDENFYLEKEKQNLGYQWLKNILSIE